MIKRILCLAGIAIVGLVACKTPSPVLPTGAPATSPAQVTEQPQSVASTAQGNAPAGCTVISPNPTPGPTEESIFPSVSDQDWVIGPPDASVTLIEYGDFQ
jgi:hypothetical protein